MGAEKPTPEELRASTAQTPADLPFADTLMNVPPPTAGAPLTPGRSSQFVRLQVHAAGGMGRVWLARDSRLEREVALKELRPEYVNNPEIARRFLTEARITGRLEHPGIVPIYELVNEGAAFSYAMRFLRGRTLSEAIKAHHAGTRTCRLDWNGPPYCKSSLRSAIRSPSRMHAA